MYYYLFVCLLHEGKIHVYSNPLCPAPNLTYQVLSNYLLN
jgi:hypothetical protein